MIKRIWTDPVWSKVIAAGIVGISIEIIALFKNITFVDVITGALFYVVDLLNREMQLKYWAIILIILLLVFLRIMIKKFLFSSESAEILYEKKKASIRQISELRINPVLWRFNVEFDSNNNPTLKNLRPYCALHNPSLKMEFNLMYGSYKCIVPNCINELTKLPHGIDDFNKQKKIIESIIEDKWEGLN
jgi:hypothetical protein